MNRHGSLAAVKRRRWAPAHFALIMFAHLFDAEEL
jgi:hypothetical protein